MSLPLTVYMDQLRTMPLQRLARLWELKPKVGTPLRFTDAPERVPYAGSLWEPVGGFDPSAFALETALRPSNATFIGGFVSSAVTEEDLRRGRYKGAQVSERLIDWRYPFLGSFYFMRCWIGDVQFSGDYWRVTVEGMQRFTQEPWGNFYGRNCRFDLGRFGCDTPRVNVYGTVAGAGVVVNAVGANPKRNFGVDNTTPAGNPAPTGTNATYTGGKVIWLVGANASTASYIQSYNSSTGEYTLWSDTPNNIQTSDECILYEDVQGVAGGGVGGLGGVRLEEKTFGQLVGIQVHAVNANKKRQAFSLNRSTGSPQVNFGDNLKLGFVHWMTGDNAGWSFQVMATDGDGPSVTPGTTTTEIILGAPTIKPIQAGDTCRVEFGCDGKEVTCKSVYLNYDNHGAYPNIPGPNLAQQTPRI